MPGFTVKLIIAFIHRITKEILTLLRNKNSNKYKYKKIINTNIRKLKGKKCFCTSFLTRNANIILLNQPPTPAGLATTKCSLVLYKGQFYQSFDMWNTYFLPTLNVYKVYEVYYAISDPNSLDHWSYCHKDEAVLPSHFKLPHTTALKAYVAPITYVKE